MNQSEHSDDEIYRVILLQRGGTELLVAPTATGFSLPEVTIPRWQRVAENLVAALKEQCGQEVICLFQPDVTTLLPAENQICYQVAEHWRCCSKSAVPTLWVPVANLDRNSFTNPSDYAAIHISLAERGASAPGPMAGPFAQLGWFKELVEWIEEEIEPRGLHLNGDFRHLNASPCFSLIRFATDGPAVWFKAVGEPNQGEFQITLALARFVPNYIPQILATRSRWNGWLMSEAEGTQLNQTMDCSLWEAGASALAQLQIESIASHRGLIDCGAHDLRIETLRHLVSPFMHVIEPLMEKQSKVPPAILGGKELRLLEERIHEAISVLGDFGIPDTLGHLDLNPGNIIVSQSRCVFLDWAEAYVGHPLFSFQYLLEHFRHVVGTDSISEAKLVAAYISRWEQIASREHLAGAMALAPLLAAFAYAAGAGSWRQPERLRDANFAAYSRSLVRRMNREAKQLVNWRTRCLA